MLPRSWTALLLLINYLLVVGTGCVSRPEERSGLLLIQTSASDQSYQECRYMRMDGLENFLTEALATRYQNKSETPKHHLISVVSSIDAHCLPQIIYELQRHSIDITEMAMAVCLSPITDRADRSMNPPPWRQ